MKCFCIRLKEERKRLGLSQTSFGDIGGVKKNAQSQYELGERTPDANYLANLAEAGVNVHYLLTGQQYNLNDVEMLARYLRLNNCSNRQKALLFEMIDLFDEMNR